ncbi:MAG TPA: MgtC/SapB family protein [Burkholderiales bacterium]|nr:MgtC/SapB family protein [Burkholderiales bacterium]
MTDWPDADAQPLLAFVASLAIGLLIGVERERNPAAKAGLRTFALTAVFGTLAAMLGEYSDGAWVPAVGLALTGLTIIAAYHRTPPEDDPGTTTVVALLLAYALGALCWYGERTLAATIAVGAAALLYFKAELRGILERFDRRDLLAVIQFATLSVVILPVLPDEGYGPYGALNPFRIWLMVVLISGLSLAGYIALKIVGVRYGLLLAGLLGGLVSSTATTLAYSRHARAGGTTGIAAGVIVLANLAVLVRLAVVAAATAPAILPRLVPVLGSALLAGLAVALVSWRGRLAEEAAFPLPAVSNPAELRASLGFGVLFAVVLLAVAWLSDVAGHRGLYAVALVSGLTDVDALTLSSLQLFTSGKLGAREAVAAIALALLANTVFKLGLVITVGGRPLARRVILPALASVVAGAVAVFAIGG